MTPSASRIRTRCRPRSESTQATTRWRRIEPRAPRVDTAPGAASGRLFVMSLRLRQVADAQALDAPGIGIQHFEDDAGRVSDSLAAGGNTAGQAEHQPAERVDILLALLVGKHGADLVLEILDGHAGIGDQAAIRTLMHHRPGI